MTRSVVGARVWVVAAIATAACKVQDDVPLEQSAHVAPSVAPAASGHIRVATASATGDVAPVVRDEMAKAAAEKRRVVVYVGAEWCEPCSRFLRAAESGELDAVFGDVTLLLFDSDRDRDRLSAAGYASRYIPLFALPAGDGTASHKQIEGGIKGDAAVANIASRLRDMLAQ
jgi:hypothetical protein